MYTAGVNGSHSTSENRNAQTSIEWKANKKKGLGLALQNNVVGSGHHQFTNERVKDGGKADFSNLHDSHMIASAPKTSSGRPGNKK